MKWNLKKKIYIETSIPSFYYEVRLDPASVARKLWTREWWENSENNYILLTSQAVIDELSIGDYPNKKLCLNIMNNLKLLPINFEITEIVENYIQHKVMPVNPIGDALHLAIASYYKCDFLLTWNCKHLANANKFGHIKRINNLLGLFVPEIITPLEILGGIN